MRLERSRHVLQYRISLKNLSCMRPNELPCIRLSVLACSKAGQHCCDRDIEHRFLILQSRIYVALFISKVYRIYFQHFGRI